MYPLQPSISGVTTDASLNMVGLRETITSLSGTRVSAGPAVRAAVGKLPGRIWYSIRFRSSSIFAGSSKNSMSDASTASTAAFVGSCNVNGPGHMKISASPARSRRITASERSAFCRATSKRFGVQFSPSVIPPKSYMSQTEGAAVGGARGVGTGARVGRPTVGGCKIGAKIGGVTGIVPLVGGCKIGAKIGDVMGVVPLGAKVGLAIVGDVIGATIGGGFGERVAASVEIWRKGAWSESFQ
jgi:hypothetical protein